MSRQIPIRLKKAEPKQIKNSFVNRKPRVAFVSLGCPKNLNDSERVMTQIARAGFDLVSDEMNADAVVINTCAFLEEASKESLAEIDRLIEAKKRGSISHISVIGCFPTRFGQSAEHPEVDAWLPIVKEGELPAVLAQRFGVQAPCSTGRVRATPRHTAYLKISEGCNHKCTFCAIPSIRGRMKSRSLQSLVDEAAELRSDGVFELNLVAEDSTDWGRDLYGKPSLSALLKALDLVEGIDWIRILYAYPSKLDAETIEILGERSVLPYLDMPIQHASDQMLRGMRRAYRKNDLSRLLKRLRRQVEGITLRTTLIVGFPGETEADFQELLDFLQEHPFDRLGVFGFSPEPGTRAGAFTDQVPEGLIAERVARVSKLQKSLSAVQLKTLRGEVLDTVGEGDGWGRTIRDAPEVDGRISAKGLELGQRYKVLVTGSSDHDLKGEIAD